MTAITINAMDISHIHPDMKYPFMMSKGIVIQSRMAATVLVCNSTTSFKDISHDVSSVSSRDLCCIGPTRACGLFSTRKTLQSKLHYTDFSARVCCNAYEKPKIISNSSSNISISRTTVSLVGCAICSVVNCAD